MPPFSQIIFKLMNNKCSPNDSIWTAQRNLAIDNGCLGYAFSIGNNVSQVTRMTDFIPWCTMCQAIWVKVWSC